MTHIARGTLLTFDKTTWTAYVLLDGSDTEAKIPVAQGIDPGSLVVDADLAVLIFDGGGTNTDDACVVGVYGAVGGSPTFTTVTATLTDAATNTQPTLLIVDHESTATPAAGFGLALAYGMKSATVPNRVAAVERILWATATDATRKGRYTLNVWDTVEREGVRIEASGTAALLGFYGAAAVAQGNIGAAAPAGGTGVAAGAYDTAAHRDALITLVNNMRALLISLGFSV